MTSTRTSSPFQRAREGLLALDENVQILKSELTRKDAVIARLSSSATCPGVVVQDHHARFQATPEQQQQTKMTRGIFTHADLASFLSSSTCTEILQFLSDLNASARGRQRDSTSKTSTERTLIVDQALTLAMQLIDETPPEDLDPQRFGNKAFRKWHAKLCEEILLTDEELHTYFTRSFGDPHRLDFGTGHEAGFVMLLLCVYKQEKDTSLLGHFLSQTLPLYLSVVRRLRLVYRLEPAGSHGVWSLDDYHFLPFILGSSQLCGGPTKPRDLLTQPSFGELTPDCDLFSDALLDILRSKRGPFKEHSPLLHSLRQCASWDDVNCGLLKMWKGEVLGKFPVAQHFLFGKTLKVTWERSDDDTNNARVQTTTTTTTDNDPLAKYFHLNSFIVNQQQVANSDATSSPQQHTLNADGSGIEIAQWTITAKSDSKISGEQELSALAESTQLDFPLPEMLFGGNFLKLQFKNLISFHFCVDEALRGCKLVQGVEPDRKLIKVTMADQWQKRRDQDGNVIKTWREDYDWTFTTRNLLRLEGGAKMSRTPRRIDYEKLKQREPILFSKEVLLFEDDLFDLGISKLSVKIRVMPSCFFVLARFFLRVDGTHVRCIDTRVFHVFDTKYVLVENSERESAVAALNVETKDLIDPNFVATILPLVSEPITFEVSLQ